MVREPNIAAISRVSLFCELWQENKNSEYLLQHSKWSTLHSQSKIFWSLNISYTYCSFGQTIKAWRNQNSGLFITCHLPPTWQTWTAWSITVCATIAWKCLLAASFYWESEFILQLLKEDSNLFTQFLGQMFHQSSAWSPIHLENLMYDKKWKTYTTAWPLCLCKVKKMPAV